MKIRSLGTKGFIKKSDKEKENIAFIMGKNAFVEAINVSSKDKDASTKTTLLDDSDIVFEYLYLGVPNIYSDDTDLTVVLNKKDKIHFMNGWDDEEQEYYLSGGYDEDEDSPGEKDYALVSGGRKVSYYESSRDIYSERNLFNHANIDEGTAFKPRDPSYVSKYTYTEPTIIYDRFNKIETSTKKIVFPAELSKLFWDVFQTASGKEIMFYGELVNDEENPDIYTVSGINFPPQKNYGGYVETVDGKYEMWAFNEIILKGKKIPLHVHTHPDFSAFSSSIDEKQIKQYIEDNKGNPFVVQLIVSNPRKSSYFIRWFDLENNTWEKPRVEFTFKEYDVESNYPGIFQFNAPRIYADSITSVKDSDSLRGLSAFWAEDEEDEEDEVKVLDLSSSKDFELYYANRFKK